jgi:hypothetical protein
MKLKLAMVLPAANAVLLSVVFALYLAPSKYLAADLLAVVMLVIALAALGFFRSEVIGGIKPLGPLLGVLLYAAVLDLSAGGGLNAASFYMRELLFGFVPFLLFYVIFRNQAPDQVPILSVAVFLIPGLVHLVVMFLDISLAIQYGDMPFLTSQKYGLLEYVKEAPRAGRRYLSLALLHLLCSGLAMTWYLRRLPYRYWAWGVSCLSVLSLALLDARAAYVSSIIGLALLGMAVGPSRAWQAQKSFLPTGRWVRLLLISLVTATAWVGYNAGKSRWVSLSDSMAAAVHDVFESNVELAQRPFVNESFWSAQIEDVGECNMEERFRCKIDQSAYLRTAWLLSGLKGLAEHPLGIGYSENYMGRLWGVSGEKGKYQHVDSFLVENIVSFGVIGVALYALIVYDLVKSLRRVVRAGNPPVMLLVVCGLIFVCIGRGLVDVFSEGLWRYLMALMGMYYGLLYSTYGRQGTDRNASVKNFTGA